MRAPVAYMTVIPPLAQRGYPPYQARAAYPKFRLFRYNGVGKGPAAVFLRARRVLFGASVVRALVVLM